MGWFFSNVPPSIPAEIRRICTGSGGGRRIEPIAQVRLGSTWYVAIRASFDTPEAAQAFTPGQVFTPAADGSYVFAAVILTEQSGGEWGYKDMDETMGPVPSEAPAMILDLLSPTTHPYALAWRARCRDHAVRRAS